MSIEKKNSSSEKYETRYYEKILVFLIPALVVEKESKFLKLLEKQNIETINEKNIKTLKTKGYYITHKGYQALAMDVVKKHKTEFQQGSFVVFQDNTETFYIFKKQQKTKSFEFIKGTSKKQIICALRESN